MDRQALDRALFRDRIQTRTATAVAAVYDQLWNSTPPIPDPAAAAAASRTRNRAGWHPPMAWDDIDDVDENPSAQEHRPLTRLEQIIITTVELLALGVGPAQIAEHLRVNPFPFNEFCSAPAGMT